MKSGTKARPFLESRSVMSPFLPGMVGLSCQLPGPKAWSALDANETPRSLLWGRNTTHMKNICITWDLQYILTSDADVTVYPVKRQ